jgi:hypothetical protein
VGGDDEDDDDDDDKAVCLETGRSFGRHGEGLSSV